MVPYCTVNLVRKHMVCKSICKWVLGTAKTEIVLASFEGWFVISYGSDISSLEEDLTARMRAKNAVFTSFSMSSLTWFEPTVELDTLMALMCTRFPRYMPRCEEGRRWWRTWRNAWFLLPSIGEREREGGREREATCLWRIGARASGPLSPCRICRASFHFHFNANPRINVYSGMSPSQSSAYTSSP